MQGESNEPVKPEGSLNRISGHSAVEAKSTYKQELYRGFSPFAAFAFCFTSVSVVPSLSTGLLGAVGMGGPAEIIWAWFVVSALSIITGLCFAELASAYPQSGSVYYWAGQLAPPHMAPAFAYVAGWLNCFGNLAGDAAFAAGLAACVAYCSQILNPDNPLTVGGQVGISIAVHFVWTLLNFMRSDYVGVLNNVSTWVQLLGTVAILLVLLSMSKERATADLVFTGGFDCTNITGIPPDDQGYSCTTTVAPYTVVLGMNVGVFAFVGYEAGSQIAEETTNPAIAGPMGIIGTVLCCFVFGTLYLLAFLFATPDIRALADPFVDTFTTVAGTGGGFVLMLIVVAMFFGAGIGGTGASSRVIFVLARDKALPLNHWLYQVWDKTFVPAHCLMVLFFLETLLLLLPLVSTTALSVVTGTCCIGYTVSYAVPLGQRITVGRHLFKPGPFHLGRWSIPCHAIAFVFNVFASIVLVWPITYPVTADNMNWTPLVFVMVIICGLIYWFAIARNAYKGPNRQDGLTEEGPGSVVGKATEEEEPPKQVHDTE